MLAQTPEGHKRDSPEVCRGVAKKSPTHSAGIVLHVWCKYYCVCPLSGIECIRYSIGTWTIVRYYSLA